MMTILDIETSEEKSKVVHLTTEKLQLELLQGGKQPPKKGNNWLKDINQWAFITVRNSSLSKVNLFLFQKREEYANTTVLILYVPKEEPIVNYVSTVDFSNDYELMDIIDNGEPSNRPDLGRRLEINEDTEQVDTLAGEPGQS